MSVKLPRRLSSKKKKPPKNNAQAEVLNKLGLEVFCTTPLDPTSMLDISVWRLEDKDPLDLKDVPHVFLHRLWLLSPDARNPSCKPQRVALSDTNKSPQEVIDSFGESQCEINPLDLVTAVFMSANTFLQQEMVVRMMQCQFAVPLLLPNIDPEESSRFLLWPLRSVVSQWRLPSPDTQGQVHEGNLASTYLPMVSCVKLGHCGVSKSQVLNRVMNGLRSPQETFLHRGMDGGQMPRRLSNGMVEIGWYLPTGDSAQDIFPVPVVISNLRGDATVYEKHLSLLCQASSAVVVFCGNLREKDRQLLAYCKDMASKLILIDLSSTEKEDENRVVGFVDQNLELDLGLPRGSVLQGGNLSEEELANGLCDTLRDLLPDKLKLVTLEAAAKLAEGQGFQVDEGATCKKAMATVEEVLKGLDEGAAQFREKQLPLQGRSWSKLAEIEKEERKQKKAGKDIDPQREKEKTEVLKEFRSYKMTPAMTLFTNALFATDKGERAYFLSWMKLRLQQMQTKRQINQVINGMSEHSEEPQNGVGDDFEDSDSFWPDSSFEEEQTVQSLDTVQRVSEEQCDDSEGSELILHMPTEKMTEPESQLEDLQSSIDPLIEQHVDTASNENDTEVAEIVENEEQISIPVFEHQNGHLESELILHSPTEERTELEPQLEDLPSPNDPLIEQQIDKMSNEKETERDEIIENEEQISSLAFEDQNGHVDSGESETTSSQEAQECEPEVTQINSDLTSVSPQHQEASSPQSIEPETSLLGLEHFLREMGLIFELTHISPGSGSQNVLRLPVLATDLLLYGIPLELVDGDASNIPIHWLACVLAEFKRRLPQEQCRSRVLTNLGVHQSRNAEVFSALFGVKFPDGRRRSTKGVYMSALYLPDHFREEMACDFLFLIDVEGLCSDNNENMLIHDNEIATLATGLSDVLMQNISSQAASELETSFSVMANALLRVKECGSMPICQLLTQDNEINSVLLSSQLSRVSDILQTETEDKEASNAKTTSSITCVKGPWSSMCLSQPVDTRYSKAVLKLKQSLFGSLKKSAAKTKATGLSEFMSRLCAIWEAVRTESFSINLQNSDMAFAFSLLCTKLSQWEDTFKKDIESWFMEVTKKIVATKAKALDPKIQSGLLKELKDEGQVEVKAGVVKLKSRIEAYLTTDDPKLSMYKPLLMRNVDDLEGQVTKEIVQRMEVVNESHCSSTQLERFEGILEKEQESKLQALLEKSKATKALIPDAELEEEFEGVWNNILSNFDFRPSETDDITARVTEILKQNLISRGHQKHVKKLEAIGQSQSPIFIVYDEHFGYRSRLKHMFEDNNRLQRLEAQRLASSIIEEYLQFAADKSSLPADFSDSYITEILENVDKSFKEKSIEIKSAFEVDLKIYLCNTACQDFQKLHDRFAKDKELLTCISTTKSNYLADFIYQFRKRDQCQRIAQAFTSMVVKPTVLDYIYGPLGMRIVEGIQRKSPQYQSQRTFHQTLLEELLEEDRFENFKEYLHSYDSFGERKVQEAVMAYLSESTEWRKWKQERLGEIIGKVAAAVSDTAEGTNGVLSDTKPLLERVCLTLEKDADVDITRAALDGPLFSITTEWDRFISCLMELLALMRLDLAQEFSQNVDITQFLQSLPVQPQSSLFNKVKGCDKQCPFCKAPCELGEVEHEVHRAMLHRPKGLLANSYCSVCPKHVEDADETSPESGGLPSLPPDWSISPEDQDSAYWRYVLAKFNVDFAEEYNQEPTHIPEEWKKITKEEALNSLKEAFLSDKC